MSNKQELVEVRHIGSDGWLTMENVIEWVKVFVLAALLAMSAMVVFYPEGLLLVWVWWHSLAVR
jgi:hypothetical protein